MSTEWARLHEELAAAGLESGLEVALSPHTSYQIGGAARCAVSVSSREEAAALAGVVSRHPGLGLLLIGRGSNLLVADEGFDGLAVLMGGAGRIPGAGRDRPTERNTTSSADSRTGSEGTAVDILIDDDRVVATGWALLPLVARRSVAARRCGLQWMVGVPGTVGGAVRMNAGGHGADVAGNLAACGVLSLRSGRITDLPVGDLGLHFRGSALADHHVVVTATFHTAAATDDSCERELTDIVAWRRANQPGGRNAGSVFVNPAPGSGSAGALIDGAGLRGRRIGTAEVSEKHANFIQADPGASAFDVVALMIEVQDTVERAHGIVMRSEVRLVGFADEVVSRFSDPRHDEPDRVGAREHLISILDGGSQP
ncbi:MAG: hypothetical protein FJW53_01930 [Actinobacteria bacterium]|nr:hypothetical protein [Actinomycetota bacterium]